MPSTRFLIHYPDGSKEQISAAERDQMQLRDELRQIDAKRYEFVGIFVAKTLRCKGFGGLSVLLRGMTPKQIQRYLERLEVIWKLKNEQEWQAEETPDGFESRLIEMGMPAGGFATPKGQIEQLEKMGWRAESVA